MDWMKELLWGNTVAHTILIYCFVIAIGVALGKVKVYGISLGITFVLFAGIAIGHFGFSVDHKVLSFIKDFGLILFVFSIGLQVGPGFFASFKKGGILLNLLALVIVILGAATTLLVHVITGMSLPMLIGVMSGAVTNTPGLGAAQEALKQAYSANPDAAVPDIGLGYAVAYPFGVLGIIFTMFFIRVVNHIAVQNELTQYNQHLHPAESMPGRMSVKIENEYFCNRTVQDVSSELHSDMVISRILHNGEVLTPSSETNLAKNDIILIVARKKLLKEIAGKLGSVSDMDLSGKTGRLESRQVLVTNRTAVGKDLGALKLRTRYNINITRVYRSGIEFIASPHLKLQMGDKLTVVGDKTALDKVAQQLGNSIKRLDEPNIIPLFLGILLGVILGSIPFMIPGIPNPIRLGLAGGPLIIAIVLSKYGHRFSLIAYTTPSAGLILRELGIVLFLASVGISAGEKFIPTLLSGDGFIWMGYGAIITLIPIILVGFFARNILKMNYLEVCGLISGSMTDPPALAYANATAQSEAPAVAYATVYPLVMFMRILVPQLMILLFL